MKIKHTACVFGIVVFCFLVASIYVQMTVDDTFTFLRFVHNMLNGNGMAFNPGEQTYGFTSVTWLLLLYLSGLLSANLLLNAKILSALFAIGSLVQFNTLMKHLTQKSNYILLGTFVFGINPVFLTIYFSGMETALAVFLLLTALLCQFKERSRDEAIVWSPAIYALGYLTRPEMMLLAVLGLLDFACFSPKGRKLRRLLWSLLLFGSIVGSWFLVAKWNFETIVPNPVLIKASQSKQIYDFSNTFIRTGLMLVSTNAADLLLFLCCLVLLLSLRKDLAWSSALARIDTAHYLLLLWVAGVGLLYLYQRVEVSPRYLLILSPVITALALRVVQVSVRTRPALMANENKIISLITSLYILHSVAATMFVFYPHTESYNGKDRVLKQFSAWLKNNTDRHSSIAAIDIGILGYFSERQVIDITGLINPDILNARRTIDYLESKKVEFLLDRHPVAGYLQGHNPNSKKVEYEPVLFLSTPSRGWKYHFVEDQNIGFTLYKMRWERETPSMP